MESIFEVPWRDVELEHVRRFLASASGEGLTWEGKATASLRGLRSKIVAGVCGLANQLGGFFIVGADEQGEAWTLPGVEDDVGEDAHDWLCRLLNGNLVDPPPFDVRRWSLADGRVVAVIRVEAAAVPPCMTKDGIVYQRLVGETRRVNDPRVLSELLGKGAAARAAAERRAVSAVNRLIDPAPLVGTVESQRVAVALAPTAARDDYSGRLFTRAFTDVLHEAARALERSVLDQRLQDEGAMHRDGYVIRRGRHIAGSWQWGLQATWNGTIALELAILRGDRPSPPTADAIVMQAWRAAASALPALTGIADAEHVLTHLAVRMTNGFRIHLPAPWSGAFEIDGIERPIQRWTTMAAPSQDERDGILRELARTVGAEMYEPESGPGGAEGGAPATA